MRITSILLGLIVFATLWGCTPKQSDHKPEGVLTEAQEKTLKNAKQVEHMLDEKNEQRLKQIDDMNK